MLKIPEINRSQIWFQSAKEPILVGLLLIFVIAALLYGCASAKEEQARARNAEIGTSQISELTECRVLAKRVDAGDAGESEYQIYKNCADLVDKKHGKK